MDAQRTLRRHISCVGIGLHSGNKVNLTLKPAPADFGIRFRRTDLGNLEVPATVRHLAGIQLATGLAHNEVSVETVEHLLAALVSLGIDNVIVELNSPEVPIMDGSAAPFIYLIQEAGVKALQAPRKYLKIVRPIMISRGDKRIALYPSEHFKVTYSISYDHPLLRHQSRTLRITEESFIEELAPARTFTFLKDVEMLRQNGLALGGSLENAIVLGETGVLNNALRFEDEFVRHKILDAVGDLALVGYPVIGHLFAHRAGHALHTEFAAKILEETHAWRFVESPDTVAVPAAFGAKAHVPRLARLTTVTEVRTPPSDREATRKDGPRGGVAQVFRPAHMPVTMKPFWPTRPSGSSRSCSRSRIACATSSGAASSRAAARRSSRTRTSFERWIACCGARPSGPASTRCCRSSSAPTPTGGSRPICGSPAIGG